MKTWITSHIQDEKEVEEFEYSVRQSRLVLDRLSQIIEGERMELLKRSRKLENYKNPSWAMQQADMIGSDRTYLTCLSKIEDLLEVSK